MIRQPYKQRLAFMTAQRHSSKHTVEATQEKKKTILQHPFEHLGENNWSHSFKAGIPFDRGERNPGGQF